MAITDHGNMFGAIDFYQKMTGEGVKPIIGMEAYIHNSDELGDKSTKQRYHLCLYAKNMTGYKNLMYLSSMAYLEGFYYYPRINKKLLRENAEGLICSAACLQGEVNWHLNTNNERNVKAGAGGYERAKEVALEYKEIFGDDFYLEIMRHGIGDQFFIDEQVIKLSNETGIKLIATNDTHYLKQEDAPPHEAFMCIAMNKQLDDPNRMRHSVEEFYLKTPEEMALLFADIPEALQNTQEIVAKCNLELDLGNPTPPNFKFTLQYAAERNLELPEPGVEFSLENDIVLFEHECELGLAERLKYVPEEKHREYRDRLRVEMDIINSMKFPGYMVIVWDFVREAKEKEIPVGPGRGSAAGSLVAFSLGITDIDPMPYDLLFERFLNPERVSMPDIDMDFCQHRRGEIIQYVVEKYGRTKVAQVITFGSLLAKGVLRDVARVMGLSYADADRMAKLIPEELGITLEKAFEKEPKIKELVDSEPQAKRVWDFALKLEGLKRNAGMHAAGVVISNEDLWHKTPLYRPSGEETVVTQYSLNFLEDVDLIKFDFLGLKTLTVIDNALKLVKKNHGEEINFSAMGLDDPEVYKTIRSGQTVGLFQIESQGMQQLNAKLGPTGFEDLIAVLALYRPGPMESGMVDDFIDRKHGRQPITYTFPAMEPILEPTYGTIVYQEQVMQVVQEIGGFTLGGADIVRRAMGKKKFDLMQKYKKEFAEGAQKQGLDYQKAADLFDLIEKFAGYGFNKSHSAAYAMVTYQTAYLKTHYPAEFMAALLTSEADNTDKVVHYIDEIKRLKIGFLPPDINKSSIEFAPIHEGDQVSVMFGLGAIKGVGESALNSILAIRKEGEFKDLNDFLSRVDSSKVNKKVYESLIKSGAMDCFGYSRKSLLNALEELVETAQSIGKIKKDAANSLFGDSAEMTEVSLEVAQLPEYDLKTLLEFEKETLGLYVIGHPLDDYRDQLDKLKYTLSSEIETLADGSDALFVGKVEEVKTKISKKGNKFGIANVMDLHGTVELMLFSDYLDQLEAMDREQPVAFKAQISKDEQFTRISVRKLMTLEEAAKTKIKSKKAEIVYDPITFALPLGDDGSILDKLVELVRQHPGGHPVNLVVRSKLQDIRIETKLSVAAEIEVKLSQTPELGVMVERAS